MTSHPGNKVTDKHQSYKKIRANKINTFTDRGTRNNNYNVNNVYYYY